MKSCIYIKNENSRNRVSIWIPAGCRNWGGDPAGLLRRAAPLERAGYLTCRDGVVALTDRGFLLSNAIIGELLEGASPEG